MKPAAWFAGVFILASTASAWGQTYVLESPSWVTIPATTTLPTTTVVQRPVVVSRPTVVGYAPTTTVQYAPATTVQYAPATTIQYAPATSVQYAPMTTVQYAAPAAAPVVVQRPLVSSAVVTQPAHTVWYSAPADIAPSLTAVPGQGYVGAAVQPAAVSTTVVGTATPIVVGTAPTVVYRPVVSTVAVPGYYVGTGSLGQPKVYVSGQPIRNALRFLTP